MVIIYAIMTVYQIFAIILKAGFEQIGLQTLSMYQWLVMSIDLLILLILIYAKGGAQYYAILQSDVPLQGPDRELSVLPGEVSYGEGSNDRSESTPEADFKRLTGFERLVAVSILLLVQLVQWTIILVACYIGNVFLTGLIISTSFVAHGFTVHKRWHSKSIVICTLVASALFFIAAQLTISFQYSQFFPIVVGLGLVYLLYAIAVLLDKRQLKKIMDKKEQLREIEKIIDKTWDIIT
jgi:hypothetical protein